MELINTNTEEVKGLLLNLSAKAKGYYDLQWEVLKKEAVLIHGYRGFHFELAGIAGITRKYLVAYSTFHMVKESYWGRGLGKVMTDDILQWAKNKHIPCVILQYHHNNLGIVKTLKKSGIQHDMKLGELSYYIKATTRWAIPLKYFMLVLVLIHYMVCIKRIKQC